MPDQYFIEDEANCLARKALGYLTKRQERGGKPITPSKALSSASWATIGSKFGFTTRRLVKKRALAILKKMLRQKT